MRKPSTNCLKLAGIVSLLLWMPTHLCAGSLAVSWASVQDSRVAGYKIKYGTTSGSYSQSLGVGNVTSYLLPDLVEGTTYYLVIAAYDSNLVEGTPSVEVSGTVLKATGAAVSKVNSNSAVVTWQTNKLSDSQVDYGTTTNYGTSTALDTSQTTSHSQTLTNLSANTAYSFRVKSKDQGGSQSVLNNLTFTTGTDTTPPNDVQNLQAVAGNSQVALSWVTPSDADYKGVLIRFRTDGVYPATNSDGTLLLDQAGSPNTPQTFLHSGLTNGITYSYSAFTYDASSNYSTTAHIQATPIALAITSIDPSRGNIGTIVTISGAGFGSSKAAGTVTFSGVAANINSWTDTSITATVPSGATSGPVAVTVNGTRSNTVDFKIGNKLSAPLRVRIKN